MRGEEGEGESGVRKGEEMRYTHPREMATVVTKLYSGPMRSKELVKGIETVSEATAHSILKKLVEDGFINKIEQSRRNVSYELADKGRSLVEEENIKARDTLVSIVRDLPAQKEIMVDVLLEEMLERLPAGWRKEEKRNILRGHLKKRIEEVEEDMCKFVTEVESVESAYG
jgi:DNA-binding PadR family transcriptional regulator